MSTPQVSISSLLKKTEHYDKDERYMATSDLCEVLKRHSGSDGGGGGGGTSLDSDTEKHICTAVLRLLHDKSNDVQAIAVKTLGVLLTTVQQEQVLEIADSLTDQVLDASKSELRDVYTIGLRTLVKTIPASAGNEVAHRLVGRLLDGIRSSDNEEIVLCCLDVLTDLLGRFGGTSVAVTRQHEAILQMCLTQLSRSSTAASGADTASPVVRKRTGNTLAGLSVVLSDPLLMRMVQSLLNLIERSVGLGKGARQRLKESSGDDPKTTVDDTRALIRTMCSVAGAVGHRLGQEQIDQIIPIFLRFTDPEDAVTGDDEEMDGEDDEDEAMGMGDDDEAAIALANELRESCFMGFESFILRCPNEVEHHLEKIVQAALAYMSYDPNYSYGDDEENDEEEAEEEDEYEDEDDEYEEEDDEEDDDDDESWKVRRGAVRALKAVVEAKKHDPALLWTTEFSIRRKKSSVVAMALVNRFKEREENCRVGVLDCFDNLLSVTVTAAKAGAIAFASEDDMNTDTSNVTAVDLRNNYSGKLVKACEKIMSTKKGNERSKSSALSLLATLCLAPGGLGGRDDITSVFKHVETFLSGGTDTALHREGTSKALRLDALSLVYTMLSSNNHSPEDVRVCLHQSLLPQLCDGVDEQWYKVIAEALRALASVPPFFVIGYSDDDDEAKRTKERSDVALMLYNAIEPKLAAHDVDQEIKECALNATASLLSDLHSSLPDEKTARLLTLLLGRLKNETTRIAAIKNLSIIAAASGSNAMEDSASIDLSPILADSITTMSSFLRLQSRSLKQTTLEALDIVITNHGSKDSFKDGELFSSVVKDITPLIVDSDLHLSHLGLQCTDSILEVCPAAGTAVKDNVLEPSLALSTSSLLQDLALDSLLAFLKQVVVANAVEFDELLSLLRQRLGQDKLGRHAVYNLAKCIAIITGSSGPDNTKKVLNEIFGVLESSTNAEEGDSLRQVQLSLLVTGDLGRMTDLSADGSADRLKTIYMSKFESSSEDLKHAAAYALGNAAVGSPATFIPAIVATLEEDNKKQQYLLLSALREFIKCSAKSSSDTLSSNLDDLVVPLEKHCADEEEGVRTMVAECFGSLTCLHPETLLPKLAKLQSDHSEIVAEEGTIADGDDKSKKNALVCWTVATSVKLAIAGKVDATQLANHMSTFVSLLKQKELSVRTAALLLVYSATHHMPQSVSGLMQEDIVPALYEVSALKLQRTVDLGPFKHNVDDAMPLRKAALSIFSTCLETLPGSLDMASFMPVLAKALGDAEDIQLHAHQIVISMCTRHASYVVNAADSFVDPLEKTLKKKTGQKTGTELERLNDWIKSALRVALAVSRVEGVMTSSQRFPEFIARVQNEEKFASKLQALNQE